MKREELLQQTKAPPPNYRNGGGGGGGGSGDDGGSGGSDDNDRCPPGKVWDPRLQGCVDEFTDPDPPDNGGGSGPEEAEDAVATITNSDGYKQAATIQFRVHNPNDFAVEVDVELNPDKSVVQDTLEAGATKEYNATWEFDNQEQTTESLCVDVASTINAEAT